MSVRTERLFDYFRDCKNRAQYVRQVYEEDWADAIEWYMNTRQTMMPEGSEWIPGDMLADAFLLLETGLAPEVLGMYQNPRWLTVEAPSIAGESYQKGVQRLIEGCFRKMDYVQRSVAAQRMGKILGHQVSKTYWMVELGQRRVPSVEVTQDFEGAPLGLKRVRRIEEHVLHNGPWTEWPDLMNLWKSPEVDRFGRHLWWIEAIDTSLDQLQAEQDDFKTDGETLYNQEALNRLKSTSSYRPTEGASGLAAKMPGMVMMGAGDFTDFQTIREQVSGIPRMAFGGPNAVTKFQFWAWVPPERQKYQDSQWRMAEFVGEEVLRDVAAPTWDLRSPYDEHGVYRIGNEPYGRSVLRWVGPEIEQRSLFRNFRLAEVIMNIFGTYAMDDEADPKDRDMLKIPAGVTRFSVPMGKSIGDVFSPIPRQPVLQEAYIEDSMFWDHITRVSGVMNPFQGAFASKRMQATEFQGTVELGMNRTKLAVVLSDLNTKLPIARRAFREYQVHMDEPQVIEYQDDRNARTEITLADLQWDVDIYVDSGAFGSLDQMQLNALTQLAATFAASPEGQITINWPELIRESFYKAGFTRAARFTRSDNEIAKIQQEQQQQALLQAAMGGAGGSATVPGGSAA